MRMRSFEHACEQAQANANRSGESWVVFCDSNHCWNAEARSASKIEATKVFNPKKDS